MKLSESELWRRIKALEGHTIYSLTRRNSNKIFHVDSLEGYYIGIEGKTPVSFWGKRGIFANYETLMQDGYLIGTIGENEEKNANLHGRYIIMAILRAALPAETEEIKGGIKSV